MPKCKCVSAAYVPWVHQRFVMCALAVTGTMVGWMMYHSGYNTLKELIFHGYTAVSHKSFRDGQCYNFKNSENNYLEGSKRYGKVYWSQASKRGVMPTVWLGYAVSGIASGIAADMFGPRHIWGLGILLASFTSFILPLTVKVSPYASVICLIFSGLGLGVVSPCSSVVVAHWSMENERTIFVALIESGMILGMIIDFVMLDQIRIATFLKPSWENWLYISGIASIVWTLMWYVLFYNRPAEHPRIPRDQLQYLRARTIGVTGCTCPRVKWKPLIPWKQILLSPPFMALILCNLAMSWLHSLSFYYMKQYLGEVFNIAVLLKSVDSIGVSLGIVLGSLLIHGWISDKLISSGLTSRTANRRFFLLFSNYTTAALLTVIPWCGCEGTLVVIAVLVVAYLHGMALGPMYANVVDLSPRYAGILRGTLTVGRGLTNIFCKLLVDSMVVQTNNYKSWQYFFYLSAAIMFLLSTPYLCFGSGDIQTWNYHGKERTTQIKLRPTTSPLASFHEMTPSSENNSR